MEFNVNAEKSRISQTIIVDRGSQIANDPKDRFFHIIVRNHKSGLESKVLAYILLRGNYEKYGLHVGNVRVPLLDVVKLSMNRMYHSNPNGSIFVRYNILSNALLILQNLSSRLQQKP